MCTRLGQNIGKICDRLLERGYPCATACAVSGSHYLAPVEDLDARLSTLRGQGLRIPLVLEVLWRTLGGFALASPTDGAHLAWWRATMPQVLAAGTGMAPDPVWMEHAVAVITATSAEDPESATMTLPVGFSEEDGFAFREGRVLHLAPDAFAKGFPQQQPPPMDEGGGGGGQGGHGGGGGGGGLPPPLSTNSAPGTYAVWLEPSPALDPELLRFTPPAADELGGAEPLWRPGCSLLNYLRIAVLHAGGFPGCAGVAEYEPLRTALTEGLRPF